MLCQVLPLGWQLPSNGRAQGNVTLVFTFGVRVNMSLEWMKLGNAILVCRLLLTSISAFMIHYLQRKCVHCHMTFLIFGKQLVSTRYRHIYNERLIGNHVWPVEWEWPWCSFLQFETVLTAIHHEIWHVLDTMCLHVNWTVHTAYNFNYLIETDGQRQWRTW